MSSAVTSQTGYGSATCPWIVRAEEGQRINVTLLDFKPKGDPQVRALYDKNPFLNWLHVGGGSTVGVALKVGLLETSTGPCKSALYFAHLS